MLFMFEVHLYDSDGGVGGDMESVLVAGVATLDKAAHLVGQQGVGLERGDEGFSVFDEGAHKLNGSVG